MFPHERSLVQRMEGRPFVLVGVNGDPNTVEEIRKMNEVAQVTWRSFKSERGGEGSAPTTWAIDVWPTYFLLDDAGVIRRRWVRIPDLNEFDTAIENLVTEVEAKHREKTPSR